jgi:acylglycerol lipase
MPSSKTCCEFVEKWITAPDGHELFTIQVHPFGIEPKAVVFFVHGLGEHCKRSAYTHLFKEYGKVGIAVLALDMRGFGRTGRRSGRLGKSDGFKQNIQDVDLIIDKFNPFKPLPLFVQGHSLGGGTALRYAFENQSKVMGCIACSPMIEAVIAPSVKGQDSNVFQKAIMGLVTNKLLQQVILTLPFDANVISRDPEAIRDFKEDPFNHTKVNILLLKEMFENGQFLLEQASKSFSIPFYGVHGTDDGLTAHDSTAKFVDLIPSIDKTFISFLDHKHELHNEIGKTLIIQSYIQWILTRVSS